MGWKMDGETKRNGTLPEEVVSLNSTKEIFMDIKPFLAKHRVKISAVVAAAVLIGIGLFVGDVKIAQVIPCLMTFDPTTVACTALTGTPQ